MTSCIEYLPDSKVTLMIQVHFGALGFTVPVEELTLRMASRANILDWLTQPKGPHLVDGASTPDSLTALAILVTPEALYDPNSPRVGLGLIYKAPYIRAASFSEAYFFYLGSMRLCVDTPQLCSAIQTNLKGSSMDN